MDLIRVDTLIRLEKGTNTRKRPAKDISDEILGPFEEMGSFSI